MPATWARICRVGRQGAQKAVENWTRVACWPRRPPRSASVRTSGLVCAACVRRAGAVRNRPARRCQASPRAVATARAAASAIKPPVMPVDSTLAAPSIPRDGPWLPGSVRGGSGRGGGGQYLTARGDLELADRLGGARQRSAVPDLAL